MTDVDALAKFDAGNAAMAAKQYAEARNIFEPIAHEADARAGYKGLAWLRIIESYLHENNLAAAQEARAALEADAEIAPHLRLEAGQRLRAYEREQAGLPARDPGENRMPAPETLVPARTLYVAINGSDANDGSKEQPFATLPRALEALRAVVSAGLPAGGAAICLEAGAYPVRKSIVLDNALSGRADAPVAIIAAQDATVCLSGGEAVRDFRPVSDPGILARLPEESKADVLVADLKAQGILEYGALAPRGFGCGSAPVVELFVNGVPMTPARWPNEGFVRTGKVLDSGSKAENRGGVFEYEGDRPLRWAQARDIWLYGYWFHDWADNAIGVASVDTAAHQIRTAHSSPYGMKEGQSYYAYNLLEEIDQPGEWYLDRETGKLYLCPPQDFDAAKTEISLLQEPLLRIEGASYVRVQGLTFELGAGEGVVVKDAEHCLLAGCLVRRCGGTGVVITGGHDDGVLSCDLHTLGRGGTVISGGGRKTLEPGGHFVENCHIHHFSRVDRTYTPAVQIEGVANRIAHNDFHDSSCHAIRLEGNDHAVEYNNVHDVVRESDDQGGLDMFYNLGYRGNILRYNYWHDIHNGRACGQAGIRLDDAISGTLIYGNLFYKCSDSNFGGVQIHGGKDNWVDNNIFIDCKYGVSFSPWGAERWAKFLASEGVIKLLKEQVDIDAPPYSDRYPELKDLSTGNDINRIWRNIAVQCGAFLTRDKGIQKTISNLVTEQDPGFADIRAKNFVLKEGAPAYDAIGFAPIPFAEIGLYVDAFRKAVP